MLRKHISKIMLAYPWNTVREHTWSWSSYISVRNGFELFTAPAEEISVCFQRTRRMITNFACGSAC